MRGTATLFFLGRKPLCPFSSVVLFVGVEEREGGLLTARMKQLVEQLSNEDNRQAPICSISIGSRLKLPLHPAPWLLQQGLGRVIEEYPSYLQFTPFEEIRTEFIRLSPFFP